MLKIVRSFGRLVILSLVLNLNSWSLELTKVDLKKALKSVQLQVNLNDKLIEIPSFSVDQKVVKLVFPKVQSKASEKFISVLSAQKDTTLKVSSEGDQTVIFIYLPYSLEGKEDLLSLQILDQGIVLDIWKPQSDFQMTSNQTESPLETSRWKKSNVKVPAKKEELNESYLQKLFESDFNQKSANSKVGAEETENKKEKTKKSWNEKQDFALKNKAQNTNNEIKSDFSMQDEVKVKNSAINKKTTFSMETYLFKVVGFIILLSGGFYLLVLAFKKGVFKKSQLSFLKNSPSVQVLNTTYLAPKRSLLLVKVQDKVFFLGSTENSINLISEITEAPKLVKKIESEVSGTNFDIQLDDDLASEINHSHLKMKEDIYQSKSSKLSAFLSNVKETTNNLKRKDHHENDFQNSPREDAKKSKFKQELQAKAQKLKPLNSIEQ